MTGTRRRGLGLLASAIVSTGLACGPARSPLPPPTRPLVPTPEEPFRASPPTVGAEEPFTAPTVERRVIEGGVTVMVAPVPDRRVVALCYVSRAAGIDDRHTVAGYVRLTTELMVTGRDVERLGATTGHAPDESRICLTLHPHQIDDAIVALADAVRRPAFDAEAAALARERWLVRVDGGLEARREAQRWLIGEQRTLGMPSTAIVEALRRFDRERAELTYARAYAPAQSAVVVAGPVAPAEIARQVEVAFGDWRVEGGTLPPSPPPMADRRPAEILVHLEPRFQASLAVAFAAPPRGAEDEAAFMILERVLGRMFSSRLNLAIREGEGHSYGAYASYAPMRHDGILTVTTAVADDQAVATAQLILAEIQRMQTHPPTLAELTAAKATARQELRADLERTPRLAAALAELFVAGASPARWRELDARLAAVDGPAVTEVARRYLARRSPVVVVGSAGVVEAFAGSRLDVAFGAEARRRPAP